MCKTIGSNLFTMPPRHKTGSKFDHGLVLMLCGSTGMLGSVSLCAKAALRSGCGMVHCAIGKSLLVPLSIKLTEPVLHSIVETTDGTPAISAFTDIERLSIRKNALLIGCGLSRNKNTAQLVHKIISCIDIDTVLDADGINAFENHLDLLKQHKANLVLTPHQGEWRRLFGKLSSDVNKRANAISKIAVEFNINIIYKGYPTIIVFNNGKSVIMPVGNSGMATAGSGDVLAGILSSLIAQGYSMDKAIPLSVFLHGKAGDMALNKSNPYSVIASDILDNIKNAINTVVGN